MALKDKINEHWEVFKTIEDDLISISKYIKFDRRNFATYSVELSKILIFTCSEVESIYKILCDEVYRTKVSSIGTFKTLLIQHLADLNLIERFDVRVEKSIGNIKPWENFSNQEIDWWKAYNKLKHEYLDNLIEGNLKHVLNAVAGLYSILVSLQLISNTAVSSGQAMIFPTPILFKSEKVASGMSEMIAVVTGSVDV